MVGGQHVRLVGNMCKEARMSKGKEKNRRSTSTLAVWEGPDGGDATLSSVRGITLWGSHPVSPDSHEGAQSRSMLRWCKDLYVCGRSSRLSPFVEARGGG